MENKINTFEKFRDFVEQVRIATGMDGDIKWASTGAAKYFALAGGEPTPENYWIWRELIRTYDTAGTRALFKPYVPTVFHDEAWVNPTHFVHISAEDKALIAYTPDEAKGLRDVQIKTTVGKYLTKFHSKDIAAAITDNEIRSFRNTMAHKKESVSGVLREVRDYNEVDDTEIRDILAVEAIKKWVDKHKDKVEEGIVLFASTREECREIYWEGPESCMDKAHKDSYMPNTGEVHPAEAYAGPDTVIAYTKRGGKINARTVCHIGVNPPRYTRIYGDSRIEKALKEIGFIDGYAASGANHLGLDGARILRIPAAAEDYYVVPYLDSPAAYVTLEGPYLRVTKATGTTSGQTQYGHVFLENDADHRACDCCGKLTSPKRFTEVRGGDEVCEPCRDLHYVFAIVDEHRNADYILSSDSRDEAGDSYHIDLDLTKVGLVQLRNENWAREEEAVHHWEGGYITFLARNVLCGERDGVEYYAGVSEVNADWLLMGNDFCRKLANPNFFTETEEEENPETITDFVHRITLARIGHGYMASAMELLHSIVITNSYVKTTVLDVALEKAWTEVAAERENSRVQVQTGRISSDNLDIAA